SLRALISPAAAVDRSAMERARAQIAEAQAYKNELDLIYAAVARTEGDGCMPPEVAERIGRVARELDAVVNGTERATQIILQAAEDIGRTLAKLAATLSSEEDKALARDIRDSVMHIFEACSFQDLTGQRVGNVVTALAEVEQRVTRLRAI